MCETRMSHHTVATILRAGLGCNTWDAHMRTQPLSSWLLLPGGELVTNALQSMQGTHRLEKRPVPDRGCCRTCRTLHVQPQAKQPCSTQLRGPLRHSLGYMQPSLGENEAGSTSKTDALCESMSHTRTRQSRDKQVASSDA